MLYASENINFKIIATTFYGQLRGNRLHRRKKKVKKRSDQFFSVQMLL